MLRRRSDGHLDTRYALVGEACGRRHMRRFQALQACELCRVLGFWEFVICERIDHETRIERQNTQLSLST